jgi:hypothetical protein
MRGTAMPRRLWNGISNSARREMFDVDLVGGEQLSHRADQRPLGSIGGLGFWFLGENCWRV